MKLIVLFILLVNSVCTAWAEDNNVHKLNNLTIVVSSCDQYAELWPAFFDFMFKNWPSLKTNNQHVPIVLITNNLSHPDPRISNIKMHQELNWSNSLIHSLQQIQTDYVLYLQDDYLINQAVNVSRLQDLLTMMQTHDISYTQISNYDPRFFNGEPYAKLAGVKIKPKFAPYRASLQAALWRKKDLLWLLKPDESPWKFEFAGNLRSQGMQSAFLAVSDNQPLAYFNACLQGHWDFKVLNYLKKMGCTELPKLLAIDQEHKLKLWFKKLQLWLEIRRDPYGLSYSNAA